MHNRHISLTFIQLYIGQRVSYRAISEMLAKIFTTLTTSYIYQIEVHAKS